MWRREGDGRSRLGGRWAVVALTVLAGLAAVTAGFWTWAAPASPQPARPPARAEAAPAPPPAAADAGAPVRGDAPPAADAPAGLPAAAPGPAAYLAQHDASVAGWERRLERERLADARFEEGLEASRVRARDVDARVQAAFSRVELEPELIEGGMLRGLRIRSIEGGTPLADAGFAPGDLLTQIDGQVLGDPAALPLVFANAGPALTLCAERDGRELCRELELR